MRSVLARLRSDHGLALVVAALIVTTLLYAQTLGHDLVNYEDAWLIRNNFVLQHPSWEDLLLWERAVASNPADGVAWSMYAHALEEEGLMDEAEQP